MRRTTVRGTAATAWAAAVVAAGACGGDAGRVNGVDDALGRDLERANAAATTASLAHVGGAGERTRFVSPLEAGAGGAGADPAPRTGGRAPRARPGRARTRVAARTPVRQVAASRAPTELAESRAPERVAEPAPAAPAPEPEAAASHTITVVSGPSPEESPAPADAPADEGRGERRGGGWGRVLGGIGGAVAGVVIRGGAVGDIDHCERDEDDRGHARRRPPARWPMGSTIPGGGALPMPEGGGRMPMPTYPRY